MHPKRRTASNEKSTNGVKRQRKLLLPPLTPPDAMSWLPASKDIDTSQKPPPLPPKKPASQREAMMAVEPSEQDVAMVMEICGDMSMAEATRYLRVKKDVESAVNAFFNSEDITKLEKDTQWDDSLLTADRDGGIDPNWRTNSLNASAAATRPNSPAPSHRSNIQPTNKEEEDDDMARALAMSTADLGGQEVGVVGPAGQPVFGPANKNYYPSEQWAMVRTGNMAETTEIVPDMEAERRILVDGEPRVLKHLPNGDYTPNLLTICSTIDGVKEALLLPQYVQNDYGQDAEWWRGHPIARPKVVHIADGSLIEPEADRQDEFLAETQRLMAFLTASTRSYGSIGALTQTDLIKDVSPASTRTRTLLELFMQTWGAAASSLSGTAGNMAGVFTTFVGTNSPEGVDTSGLNLIDLPVVLGEDEKADLSELLDALLWDADVDDIDNYIEMPAHVLVMRVYQTNPAMARQLRVDVPAVFYVDKYLKENIAVTRATRIAMAKGKTRIAKIEEVEKKLRTWKHPQKEEQLDAGLLLKHTIGHFSGQNKIDAGKNDRTAVDEQQPDAQPPHYAEITKKLEELASNIERKLKVLAEEKEKTRKAIADMSKTPIPGMEIEDLKHRYTLRGVATNPNITYMLCPIDPTSEQPPTDEDDKTPAGLCWWRIEYKDSPPTLTKTRVDDFDVFRAVELEHSSALLVYASDAMSTSRTDVQRLPEALQTFVDRDNELFESELHAERNATMHTETMSYDMTDIPRDSIERPSRASMDSTRAAGGLSDDEDGPPPDYTSGSHPSYGLPPDFKQDYDGYESDGDAPVAEIRLDDEDEATEMVEKSHEPLLTGNQGVKDAKDGSVNDDEGW